jgi:hypothetical protein
MTSETLAKLQADLEVQLPQEYLDVFKNYPFSDNHFGMEMLVDDENVLTQRNRSAAKKPTRRKPRPTVSDGFFWIGSDGGELSFYVKLGRGFHGVWYFDIETGDTQKYCDDIKDYLQKCRKIDADEERLPNETSKWPLWKQNVYALSLLIGFILFGYLVFLGLRWLLAYFKLI